ncbi:MAG: hypothetical protein KTR18_14625 [Acidiferrobacterales bacterium]|nr:hypothetical protein [Acidiferrobacterales bacterium]
MTAGGRRLATLFHVASLEEPSDLKPTYHVKYVSKLPWLQMHNILTL